MSSRRKWAGLALGLLLGMLPVGVYAAETGQETASAENVGGIEINEGSFPDAVFRQYVLDGIDSDRDGRLSLGEISGCTSIDVSGRGISSLEGVGYFSALERLNCNFNQLKSLDVSGNASLRNLYCGSNQLVSLDVGGNRSLWVLNCSSNQLKSLDVGGAVALAYLYCDSNQLSSLDVSGAVALRELNCSSNRLGILDVGGNPALESLSCSSNRLASLDVSGNASLKDLDCSSNRLASLDVGRNAALTFLDCSFNQLGSLDVGGNAALERLDCSSNRLGSLEVSGKEALKSLYCNANQLSSLGVSGNPALTGLDCSANQLSSLDVSGNPALTGLSCSRNYLGSLNISSLQNLFLLKCNYNRIILHGGRLDMPSYDSDFDPSKASNFQGVVLDGTVLSLQEGMAEGSYDYDCGNGKSITVYVGRPESLKDIAVSGIPVPKAGEAPDSSGAKAMYGDREAEISDITWFPSLSESGSFEQDQTYKVRIEIAGCPFVSGKATVNGIEAGLSFDSDGDVAVAYIFTDKEEGTAPDGSTNQGEITEKEFHFTDVSQIPGEWKYESVKFVNDRGIMGGIGGSNEFQPDSTLTRAMFATVLYRMAGEPAVSYTARFTDVPDGQWYSSAILWAAGNGIVSGYTDGSYGINDNITREQIAKMLFLYGESQGYDVSGASPLDAFTDKDKVSGWATGYMQWAVNTGMISGKPNGDDTFRLDPKGQATRAECAKMLKMFAEKYW